MIATIRLTIRLPSALCWLAVAVALASGAASSANAQLAVPGYPPCHPGTRGTLATAHPSPLAVTVHARELRQTVESFGASDAWSIQFVGGWPLEKREAIADLLFEAGLDENDEPRGIALSMWRFNIGAGSSRQNNIRPDLWRRADTFYSEDFSAYDWDRLPGQRWFLHAAKARGLEKTTAFVNSPPINMTKNGKAFADAASGSTNLADDRVDDFARYLADILDHFRSAEGIHFDALSPVNEPQWDWTSGSQEGSPYSTSDIKRVVDALALVDLGGTRIEIPESGENKYLYQDSLDDYIDAFFDPASGGYVGDKIDATVAGHSYWTDTLSSGLIGSRRLLRAKLDQYPGMKYAMTEYSILGDYGPGRDLGIDPALHIARTLHFDMTITEASSWQWWLAVSPYFYKDGLVYVDYRRLNGNFYESKMLWAFGNFSRFIRPGMVRVATSRSDGSRPFDDATGLMVSSYVHPRLNIAVTVFVNWAEESRAVALEYRDIEIDGVIPYLTSASDDLAPYELLAPNDAVEIPPRSIATLVAYHSRLSMPPRSVVVAVLASAVRATRSGVIPIAIFGEPEFDVAEIDLSTLSLGPGGARPVHRVGGHFEDLDGDGHADLVSHFAVREVGLGVGDERVCASGLGLDGRAFEGCGAIRTLP